MSTPEQSAEDSYLVLLRHGRSYGNLNHTIIQGSGPDPKNTIDNLGHRQARQTAGVLLSRGILPVAAYCSPLARARDTGEVGLRLMGSDLELIEHDGLKEMCKGLQGLEGGMEGRLRTNVETPEFKKQALEGGWDFRYGSQQSGGQTPREVGNLALLAMNEIADSPTLPLLSREGWTGMTLVYSHAQAIRYAIGTALGLSFEETNTRFMLRNGEGIIMKRDSNKAWQEMGRITISNLN